MRVFALILAGAVAGSIGRAQDVAPSSAAAKRMDDVLTQRAAQGYSGNAMLVEGDRVTLAKGYGLANRARNIKFDASSVIQIGSNTKDLTVIAVLQLVQAGKLSLDDSISGIWQGVPPAKRGITIRHLLTHRAGLPQHGGDDFAAVRRPDMVDAMLDTPLLFPPGTKESYSNVGYSVLAAIIELKSGMSFDAYVAERILKPTGIHETGLLLPRFDNARVAHGYRRDGTDFGTMLSRPHADDGSYWNLRGNGGMLSTLADMRRFYDAIYADRLVPPALRRLRFPDESIDLAGSDGINFFFYLRDPAAKRTVLLSSTNEAVPGGEVMRQVRGALNPNQLPEEDVAASQRPTSTQTDRLPDTPYGATVGKWLSAYNAGSKDDLARAQALTLPIEADTRTPEERAASAATRRANWGRLTVSNVQLDGPTRIRIAAKPEHGDPLTLQFEFKADDSGHIALIRIVQ